MTIPMPVPPKASADWDPARVYVRARVRRPWEYTYIGPIAGRTDFVWQVWVCAELRGGEWGWRCNLETGTAWDARRRADRIVRLARQIDAVVTTTWCDALEWAAGLLNDEPTAVLRAQQNRAIREAQLSPHARPRSEAGIGLFQQAPASFGRSSAGIWD